MTPVSTRLIRLDMVPYFQANPRVSGYAKAAADLSVTRKRLQADISQLWMCGLARLRPRRPSTSESDNDTIKGHLLGGYG